MPRGKKKPQVSRMEAVRQALTALGGDALPVAIQGYVKESFGVNMPTNTISNYKGLLRKGAVKTVKAASKPAAMAIKPVVVTAPKASAPRENGISVADIVAVKALAARLGSAKLQELAKVLG